ncbi:MAG: Gfo/Idh/MocA family oxidoreductase [Verrucomicrobiaceae bacterium]|nr:MAG: Gfo/Idh/MocA family oxidoreductase [Verrucomicrobiaceae bacterium]
MIKVGVVGLGKMGLSHFSIVNAHPDTDVKVCDATGYLVDGLVKYTNVTAYKDFDELLEKEPLDAVMIVTPSKMHAGMVRKALEKGLHVFCEKPFCLDWKDSEELTKLAAEKGLVSQVGYHYRYVGAFQEMKRVVDSGALGEITHVLAEAYGPVVLRPKGSTWRTQRSEGGGCLYDYAAHAINLVNWYFGEPSGVSGTVLNSIFSADTDDEVYSTLLYPSGMSAHLSVNWSDESQRKMSTRITMTGTNGRMYADRQECQLYLREAMPALPEYQKGWNVRYTTDLTKEVNFYLRGEEYSAQIDDFIKAIIQKRVNTNNTFSEAAATDKTIAMIIADKDRSPSNSRATPVVAATKKSWFARK